MIRNTESGFGLVSILFHWVMAAMFFVQFWIGLTLESEPDAAAKARLVSRHISLGFVILFLWLLRALWTMTSRRRPSLPAGMQKSERRIARSAHAALFWLLPITPLVGWAVLSTHLGPPPLDPSVFGLFRMPRLPIAPSSYAAGLWTVLHAFLAYGMLFLAGVHTLAALRHQFTAKDNLLGRMIVPGAKLNEE